MVVKEEIVYSLCLICKLRGSQNKLIEMAFCLYNVSGGKGRGGGQSQ